MIEGIRNIEVALGDGIKRLMPSEVRNLNVARKSIVSTTFIKENEIFAEKNLTIKRPGTGISPMYWDELLGSKASRDYHPDEIIDFPEATS